MLVMGREGEKSVTQERGSAFRKGRNYLSQWLIAASVDASQLIIVALVAAIVIIAIVVIVARPDHGAADFKYHLSVNAIELNDTELDKALDMAQAAGANSTSSGAIWWYMNQDHPPRSYDWSYLDRLVNAAEARGMTVRLQLFGTPDWVHPSLRHTITNPEDRSWHPPRGSTELEHWATLFTMWYHVTKAAWRATRYGTSLI